MAQTADRRTNVRGYTKRDGTRVKSHTRAPTGKELADAIAASLSGAGRKSGLPASSPLTKAKSEYLKRETISAAVESSPLLLTGGAVALLAAPLALPVAAVGAGGYVAFKRHRAGKQEIRSMAQAKRLTKKRWEQRGKKLKKSGIKALKANEKRKAKRRARRRQQMMILAYQVVPGLRWWHGRRWEGDQVRLKKQQKVQAGEVDWLNDKQNDIVIRQAEIEDELARGVEGDPNRLQELQDAQKDDVRDWYRGFDAFSEREEGFSSQRSELKARGKALKAAGYQKKLNTKDKKKSGKPGVSATGSDPSDRIKGIGEAPGKGTESAFDTTWDLLFEDWKLPKVPTPLPF
jgi:hypothetical protein